MSTSTLAPLVTQRQPLSVRAAAYAEMSKPKISALVLFTVGIGALAGSASSGVPLSLWTLTHTLLATGLVAASTGALNQLLERRTDALMPRTANRPLPSGRLAPAEVAWFGAATVVVGTAWLAVAVNAMTALVGVITWTLYVWVYTPLKRRTTINTMVGAIGGALPMVMGWLSSGAPLGVDAWTLFMILYLWQFPHFMAIAWLYREDYAAADMKMHTVVDPSGQLAGRQALATALVLLVVSLLPVQLLLAERPDRFMYTLWALLLGAAYVAASSRFMVRRDRASARFLLRTSLIYLPALLAAMWMALGCPWPATGL